VGDQVGNKDFRAMKKVSIAAAMALGIGVLGVLPAIAADVPNTVALRKVSDTRYNLSMNLLDQYAQQEIGIKIRRTSGGVSEIFMLPTKVLGNEGKATVAVNRKLQLDDVLLFTVKNVVIYKIAIKDATFIDLNNPNESTVPAIETPESATPTVSESPAPSPSATRSERPIDKASYPNDAALKVAANGRYVLSINMLDIYIGQEIAIERVRTVKGVSETLPIAKKVLGAEGKTSVSFRGPVKKGDLFVMKSGNLVLFSYSVKANAT
jgi:hypothetical protein